MEFTPNLLLDIVSLVCMAMVIGPLILPARLFYATIGGEPRLIAGRLIVIGFIGATISTLMYNIKI